MIATLMICVHLAWIRLKDLVTRQTLKIISERKDATPKHRPLVKVYLSNGKEVGQILLREGFARPWHPHHKIDWCS